MDGIKNLLLDFGGVLYNIRYENIADAFRSYGIGRFEEYYTKACQSDFIDDFETGKITTDTFRECIRSQAGIPLTDRQIDTAWNAILIGMPQKHADLLCSLKERYHLYLFSNTNQINYDLFYPQMMNQLGMDIFSAYFKKVYFSFKIGQKKPQVKAFEYVLQDAGINTAETLFIDDRPQHVEGAKKAGLNAFHLRDGLNITNLFDENFLFSGELKNAASGFKLKKNLFP